MVQCVVVLSGGLDSATALGMAHGQYGDLARMNCVSFDYGQRHDAELNAAQNLANWYGAEWKLIRFQEDVFIGGVLTDTAKEVPDMSYADLPEGEMSPTYVPFRNGNLLSQATAYADSLLRGTDDTALVYAGMHAEDAAGFAYADCTPEFLGAMASAIYVGTYHKVRLWTPFMHRTKAEIIKIGVELGVPYQMTYSCYRGEEIACGRCSTCRARLEAFAAAGFNDPIPYEEAHV
jgi:7-cyano-7-deazaguanine synthase